MPVGSLEAFLFFEDRTENREIGAALGSASDFTFGVARHGNHRLSFRASLAPDIAYVFGRDIGRTQMHTVCSNRERNVAARVDQQPGSLR